VQIAEPVKHIGIHTVSIQLHPELSASVVVNVAMTSEEAKLQLKADKKESNSAQKEGDVAEEVSPE